MATGWSGRRPGRPWHYWWQAQALEAVVDAAERLVGVDPPAAAVERDRAARLVAGIRRRNGGRLTTGFVDDMGWLGLALLRAEERLGLDTAAAVADLLAAVRGAWHPAYGALSWRPGDDYLNTPANGPAAILAARRYRWSGAAADLDLARGLVHWLHRTVVDPLDGTVADGLRVRPGQARLDRTQYTYNPGLVVGADLALAAATGEVHLVGHATWVGHAAVAALTRPDGLLPDEGGGDGGLFKGILARHLAALVARTGDRRLHAFLARWGTAVWRSAGPHGLVGPDWGRSPRGRVELSTHCAGLALLERLAALAPDVAALPGPATAAPGSR